MCFGYKVFISRRIHFSTYYCMVTQIIPGYAAKNLIIKSFLVIYRWFYEVFKYLSTYIYIFISLFCNKKTFVPG